MEEINIFKKNLDDLQEIFPNTKKCNITEFLKKNFKENIHFIIKQNVKTSNIIFCNDSFSFESKSNSISSNSVSCHCEILCCNCDFSNLNQFYMK